MSERRVSEFFVNNTHGFTASINYKGGKKKNYNGSNSFGRMDANARRARAMLESGVNGSQPGVGGFRRRSTQTLRFNGRRI